MANGIQDITISRDSLEILIKMSGISELFDSDYYLETNEDVRAAVASGALPHPFEHFVASGFLEGRAPYHVKVDKAFYLRNNPDVAEAIRLGQFKNAQHHFETMGRREGRLPTAHAALKQRGNLLSRGRT